MMPHRVEAREAIEPELLTVSSFAVRCSDSDVGGFVEQILELLSDGHRIVDLSSHDRRGTVIELRALKEEIANGD